MKKLFATSLLVLLIIGALSAITANGNNSVIIENKGQWDKEVQFLIKSNGMNAWITSSGVVYDFYTIEKENSSELSKQKMMKALHKPLMPEEKIRRKGHVVKTEIIREKAANKDQILSMKGNKQQITQHNYFRGNDSKKWVTSVPTYKELMAYNVYEGIDIHYYFENDRLRYDYILAPGAEVSAIKFKIDMGDDARYTSYVNRSGELVLKTSMGDVFHNKIYAYQEYSGKHQAVECKFELKSDGSIGFTADNYDKSRELIIDPLVYSTYFGGNSGEFIYQFELDDDENIIYAGTTISDNYPTTIGSYDEYLDDQEGFISKLSSNGSELIFSTFFGGSYWEYIGDMKIDDTGNIYVCGGTASTDLPVTSDAFCSTYHSCTGCSDNTEDGFMAKFNSDCSELLYSTYFGGGGNDGAMHIDLSSSNEVYIMGMTSSLYPDFPITDGAYDNTNDGGYDIYAMKFNSNYSIIDFCTYIGGNSYDGGGADMKIDLSGNVYITGSTASDDFPVTIDALQGSLSGLYDIFFTILNNSGTGLIYSSYLGGEEIEVGMALQLMNDGKVAIFGLTSSYNYPTTANATFPTFIGGNDDWVGDGIITVFNEDYQSLYYSSFFGGSNNDAIYDGKMKEGGKAFVTGFTLSDDLPITTNAYNNVLNGTVDMFAAVMNINTGEIEYSTYIGGSDDDYGFYIDFNEDANLILTGATYSNDFPVTQGAYDETYNGDYFGDMSISVLDILTVKTWDPFGSIIGLDKNLDYSRNSKQGGEIVIGYNILAKGICWNTEGNPTISDDYVDEGPGNGSFVSLLSNLTPGTLYYFRAYAMNQNGIVYGEEYTFTTWEEEIGPEASCKKSIAVELGEDGTVSITADDVDNGSTAEAGIKSLEIDKSEFDCDDVGEVIVTLIVTDEYDNVATCEATVIVVDNIAPTITVSVSPTTLWPPNNQMKAITATVEVDDNCSGVTYELTSITSNENISGDVANASYGTEDLSFNLRASRLGRGSGRTYTIKYTATDASGNTATAEATVTVPRNPKLIALGNESDEGYFINIYPNPADDLVTIEAVFAEKHDLVIRLLDIFGTEMYNLSKSGVSGLLEKIDLSQFPSGMYIIEIKTGGEVFREKIIKKH